MPKRHVVKAGESVVSLAEQYGLFSQTIWDAPENAALREERPDMNTLLPGDVVVIPDLRAKSASGATDGTLRFRRKGIPAHFKIQLFDFGEPRANQSYTLVVDGETIEGATNGDGVLETPLPPTAKSGVLTIGEDAFRVELSFGHLDPLTELSGVARRLGNLGYPCSPTGRMDAKTKGAIEAFQRAQALEVTGEADDATVERLAELHDAVAEDPTAKQDANP